MSQRTTAFPDCYSECDVFLYLERWTLVNHILAVELIFGRMKLLYVELVYKNISQGFYELVFSLSSNYNDVEMSARN